MHGPLVLTIDTPATNVNEALSPSRSLREAADKLQLSVDPAAWEMLEAYCRHLWAWNEKLNLTRHVTFDQFARRDLLDCVQLAAHLADGIEVLDVGTGGGVPGVVLAILRPDLRVSLCGSVGKKAKAVQDMVRQLELSVAVYPQRVQAVLEDLRFHVLVTRATGSLSQLLGWLSDYWLQFDQLLAVKGPRWVEERGAARHRGLMHGIELRCLETYAMPGTESSSVILSLTRQRAAPLKAVGANRGCRLA